MLAYCCRTKKFTVKVPPVRIGDGSDGAKEASAARGSDALAGGLDWYLRLTSGTSGRTRDLVERDLLHVVVEVRVVGTG